eukprot:6285303-Ditylum_brightwellii.AAC.1
MDNLEQTSQVENLGVDDVGFRVNLPVVVGVELVGVSSMVIDDDGRLGIDSLQSHKKMIYRDWVMVLAISVHEVLP